MVDLKALAKGAEARKTYDPKLTFGKGKNSEVYRVVEVTSIGPTEFKYQDKRDKTEKEALTLSVRLLEHGGMTQGEPDEDMREGGNYSLVFPGSSSALTDGILKIWTAHKQNLQGVRIRVETYNYNHAQFGLTRGYRVSEIPNPK